MSCGLLPDHLDLVFRINDNGAGPELLRQVFLERGWLEFDEETQHDYDWNLWWRTSRFRTSDYSMVYPWQRLNHYPKSTLITKKDALARNLKRMQCVHGARVFNFSPLSFNLPNDYTKYVKVYESMRQKTNQRTAYWICKPADLSRGRGIFIFGDLSDLLYDCNAVVQLYIDNPLLIGGYKSDLRIYVAVTSFQPLKVYVHEEGIVRFSTEKFDLSSTKNVFAHLTNTSINKHSPGYTEDKEQVGPGCKWTLTQLRHYFLSSNINDQMLWRRIINIVVLTLLIQAPQVQRVEGCFELYGFDILVDENLKPWLLEVQRVEGCFELYGFDILVDENLKPWLLEVNFSPSLSADCQVDNLAKKPMLHDLMDLLHYTAQDATRGGGGGGEGGFQHHHFQDRNLQKRRSVPAQRGGGVAGSKRNDQLRAQGQKANGIHSGRTDISSHGGSQENLSGRLSWPGRKSSSHEDTAMAREGRRSRAFSITQNGKKETKEVELKFNSGGDGGGGGGDREVQTALMDVGGGSRCSAQKGVTTSSPRNGRDQIHNAALVDAALASGQPPDQSSFPGAFCQQHSQTTVSADSHHSGGSEDSKGSKDSGISSGKGSKDSSIGSGGRSSRFAAPQGSAFGSLPEMASSSSSPLHHHRAGSDLRRRDSDGGGEELSFHLPSLESSTSSKHSRGRVWTPHRTNYHNNESDQPDESHHHGGRFGGPVQEENRHGLRGCFGGEVHGKAGSTKPLPGDGPGKWRQHRESRPPLTQRSTTSTVSGFRAGSRISITHHRQQSSMSHYPNTLPPTSRMPHGYQPQSNAPAQHASFPHLKKRVGNFFLVFPFNEATHKVATTMDAKVIIRETQNLIKEALKTVSCSRSGADHDGADSGVGRHCEGLWMPLKTVGDEA